MYTYLTSPSHQKLSLQFGHIFLANSVDVAAVKEDQYVPEFQFSEKWPSLIYL